MLDIWSFIYQFWKFDELLSLLVLLQGLAVALFSAGTGMMIMRRTSKGPVVKGLFRISLTTFLILCLFVIILFRRSQFPPDLITSSALFLGACLYYFTVDITEALRKKIERKIFMAKKLEDQLRGLSLIDELTGLYSYRGFLNLIDHHIRLAIRDKKRILIFYADIENLQGIKNSLGHDEARMIVIETTKLLKKTFRTSDIIARVREDQFMVFLIGSTDDHADAVSDNFRKSLESYNAARHKKYKLPVNYCMAPYNPAFNQVFDNIHAQAEDFMSSIKTAKEGAAAV